MAGSVVIAALGVLGAMLAPALAAGAIPSAPTPVNTSAPTLTGTPSLGQKLSCSTGTWSNNPTGYSYAWLRDGSPISGQSGSTYVVQNADQGHSISCQVTAGDEGGNYTISSLPSGSYKVSFARESETGGNYLSQFFNGKTAPGEANPVSVTAPAATGGVNAELQAGGQITGRVVDAVSKAPIASAFVCAEQASTKPEFGSCELTNANGEYTLMGLPIASYHVVFYAYALTSSYRLQFYNGKSSSGEADSVSVTAGATTSGINAELRPYNEGAAIEGAVTDAKTHLGIGGIEVCASPANEDLIGECATTEAVTGKYKLPGLGEGEFVVTFQPESCTSAGCKQPNYVREYYHDVYAFGEATKEKLEAHKTKTLLNEEMAEGGQIKGVARDAVSHELLADIQVCTGAFQTIGKEPEFFGDCTTTGPAGEYTLSGLPAGNYVVDFSTTKANYLEYASPSTAVKTGPAAEVNAELQRGGQIAGRVTDATTHGPVAGAEVCVKGPASQCARTDASGEYLLSRLPGGTYEADYFVENETLNYLPQVRSNVVVTQGQLAGGIDAELSPGGQITGRVTDAVTHAGLTHIVVCAEQVAGGKTYQCASTMAGSASASATSNAFAIPPRSAFKLAKKPRFNAKTGNLEFFFIVPQGGTFKWGLFFDNSDTGFAASLGVSLRAGAFLAEPQAVAGAVRLRGKRHGSKRHGGGRCTKGYVKHGSTCVPRLVPFSRGSRTVPAGTVDVEVHASGKALKALKTGHALHVSGTFTFQSSLGGFPVTHKERVVVRPPKKRGKHRHKKHRRK